jgi:CYTH domain-containing protein
MTESRTRSSGTEIERKFLIREFPKLPHFSAATSITQGYIAVGSEGTEVRLRAKGGRFTQAVKRGSGLERLETEIELSKDQFEALWSLSEGRRIDKERYEIPHAGVVIELDVFHGGLEGLIVAEVEFGSVADSAEFEPPAWFGEEVTEDPRYRNRSLAIDGRP